MSRNDHASIVRQDFSDWVEVLPGSPVPDGPCIRQRAEGSFAYWTDSSSFYEDGVVSQWDADAGIRTFVPPARLPDTDGSVIDARIVRPDGLSTRRTLVRIGGRWGDVDGRAWQVDHIESFTVLYRAACR